MVYIAYNYVGIITSIVSAKSVELANAYWQGLGIDVNTHKCLETDFTSLNDHPTGVIPILKTKTIKGTSIFPTGRPDDREFVLQQKD